MAKFCTNCGKELEEGKKCDCQKASTKKTSEKATPENTEFDFNQYVNSYVAMVKGIFTKPIDTIKKYTTSNNFILGIIALVLNCIISGILIYCIASESMESLGSLLGYGSLNMISKSVEIPFMKVFLYGFIFMAASFSVTALMIYVVANLILKDKIDIKKAFALVGTCSAFTTVTSILNILLTYISLKLMIIVLLVAAMFYSLYLYQGIGEVTEVNKNKLAYIYVAAMLVVSLVVGYILPKILF